MDKNSVLLKLIATGSDKNYDGYLKLMNALKVLHYWDKVKGDAVPTIDFKKVSDDAHSTYPYLDFSRMKTDYYFNDVEAAKVARYVNAMDLYVDLAESIPTPASQQLELKEVATAEVAA